MRMKVKIWMVLVDRYGFVGGDITSPLSTGEYVLVAEVTHVSSSASPIYDWNVTFTVTDLESRHSNHI